MLFLKYAVTAVLAASFTLPLFAQYRGIAPKGPSSTAQASREYMQNLVGNLLQQVKALQDENARLAEEVQRLSREVKNLQDGAGRNSGDLERIRSRCAAESEANRQHIRRLEKLVKDLASAMAKPRNPSATAGERLSRRRIAPGRLSGEFVEHTVEKGHVLYHIAKAYNVTVREIKQANNLKSDSLYVGQKLLIPVKKK